MNVEHAKQVVGSFIEDAIQTCIYEVSWRLAGYISDSCPFWNRVSFKTCEYTACIVLQELPPGARPHCVPSGFDKELLEPWKQRVEATIENKIQQLLCQYGGWGYRRFLRSNGYYEYKKAHRLARVGVELANDWCFMLSLVTIMYERPELLPRLQRLVANAYI
jgi:hypothetical protein